MRTWLEENIKQQKRKRKTNLKEKKIAVHEDGVQRSCK